MTLTEFYKQSGFFSDAISHFTYKPAVRERAISLHKRLMGQLEQSKRFNPDPYHKRTTTLYNRLRPITRELVMSGGVPR